MAPLLLLAALIVALTPGCGATQDTDPGQPVVVEASAPPEEPDPAEEPPAAEPREGELVLSEDACETDEDCVPSGCCHAASCVAADDAPSCEDTMCTQECRYGTLDCGGGCLCHEGRCAARLSVAPQLLPHE